MRHKMKTESLVNILDEVRAWTVNTNGLTPEEVSLNVTLFIDRIEAAYKREIADALNTGAFVEATRKRKTVTDCNGLNTAKMREVVRELLDTMYDMGIDEETVAIAIESPNCHMKAHSVAQVIKKAKAALAAPPRNCDRPFRVEGPANNAADKAWLAFKRCNPNTYFDVSGLLQCIAWLLTEAKGDNNADK